MIKTRPGANQRSVTGFTPNYSRRSVNAPMISRHTEAAAEASPSEAECSQNQCSRFAAHGAPGGCGHLVTEKRKRPPVG